MLGGDQQDDRPKDFGPIDKTSFNPDGDDGDDNSQDSGNQKKHEDGGSQVAAIRDDSQAKP